MCSSAQGVLRTAAAALEASPSPSCLLQLAGGAVSFLPRVMLQHLPLCSLGLLMGSQPGQKPRGKFMKHLQALSFPEVQPHARALGHRFVPFIPFRVAGRQFFSGAQTWMLCTLG